VTARRSAATAEEALQAAVAAAIASSKAETADLETASSNALAGLQRLARLGASARSAAGDGVGNPFAPLAAEAADGLASHIARQREVLGTFNIALFGRTGAGKSSLLSALAELDGSLVSPGESDWTTEVNPVPWQGCLLYDTPGINGWGRSRSRSDLERTARHAVEVADVVLLCFDSQSQQAMEFKKVSAWVKEYGKPVIAVLNNRNLLWRDPEDCPEASRPGLSRSMQEHAANIRDELAGIGLADTPIVGLQAQRALDARAAQPYAGPDPVNHAARRAERGTEWLYRWSNLACLEQLLAEMITAGGSQLRLRVLREGVRAVLTGASSDIAAAAAEVSPSLEVLETTIESALSVLGYPEEDHRQHLRRDAQEKDPLTRLEDLRGTPFAASATGRLETHVGHLAASHLGRLRSSSAKRAAACVRAAFDQRTTMSADEFAEAVFDKKAIASAVEEVWSAAGAFLAQELGIALDEAQSDLSASAEQTRIKGSTGTGTRSFATALRASGIATGGVGAVLGVLAAANFWNPVGWVAAAALVSTALVSTVLRWLSTKARKKAERQRLAARSEALATTRLAVDDAYRGIEERLILELAQEAWRQHADPLRSLLGEATRLRKALHSADSTATELARLAEAIRNSPIAGQVVADAAQSVVMRSGSGRDAHAVFLGEDWLDQGVPPARAAHHGASLRLLEQREEDARRLGSALAALWTSPEAKAVDAWLRALEREIEPSGAVPRIAARARETSQRPPAIVLLGDYSAGKSSLLKRLIIETNSPLPEELAVGGAPTTGTALRYPWLHLELLDTPGLQSSRALDTETALNALSGAALVVVVVQVNLMVGDIAQIESALAGTETQPPLASRALFLINRCDEFGADPAHDPEEFLRRRKRKEDELHELLASRGFTTPVLLHTLAADPYGLVGNRRELSRDDYNESFRSWDGVLPLVSALTSTDVNLPAMQMHGALVEAHAGLLRLRQHALNRLDTIHHDRGATAAVHQEVTSAIESGKVLGRSLEQRADLVVRAHAERAAAEALAASPGDLERAASSAARWWLDPAVTADVATYWTEAEREIERWMRRTASSVRRSSPAVADALKALKPTAKAPKWQRRRAGRRLAAATKQSSAAAKALGHRDVVYKIGKAVGHKWKPWGAVKGAAKVTRVGAALGVVAVGFDIYSWVEDVRTETDQERHRAELADFVEASMQEVLAKVTRGKSPEGPVRFLDAVTADYSDAADDLSSTLSNLDAQASKVQDELTVVNHHFDSIPSAQEG